MTTTKNLHQPKQAVSHQISSSDKKEYISGYINKLLKTRLQPRNQIAAVSGLTNTYIKDLEEGNIINVRREKLLALSVALKLKLRDVDELLSVFDRSVLTRDDIPLFIELSKRSKITTAMTPLFSAMPFGQVLAIENNPGPYFIVNPEPTYMLMASGYGRFEKNNWLENHPLDEFFREQIIRERNRLFLENVGSHQTEQYLCIECLKQYVKRYNDALEKSLRRNHIRNVITALEEHENFMLYLLDVCPSVSFSIKQTGQPVQNPDLLIMVFWPQHRLKWLRSGKLNGFTSRQPALLQQYKEELLAIKETVIDKYRDRNKLIAFLKELLNC